MNLPELRLFLVHHGATLSPDVDPMRPLSASGREAVSRLASAVAARSVKPGAIWHSGKLRARQTGEAFRDACNPLAEFRVQPGLQPDDRPARVMDLLQAEEGELMIVGHMPHLPRLLTELLRAPQTAWFPLNGVVVLERRDGRWNELWQLAPAGTPHPP